MAPPKVVITIERGNRKVFVDGREYGPGLHRPNITFKDPDLPSLKIGPGANPLTVTGWGLRTLSMLYLSRSLEAGGDSAASARAQRLLGSLARTAGGTGGPRTEVMMSAGTLMLIAFFLILLFLLLLMTGFARGLRITLTVAPGRQVTIGSQVFPPSGPARHTTTFLVDRELVSVGREDVAVTLDPGIDGSTRSFEVSRRRLKTLHLDANMDGRLVAYGCYVGTTRGSGLFVTALAVESVPQCKWCPPDVIVCGVNPRCR